jgi:hypothetical protein
MAVAALLVVANLVAHWHQATVVHARCAEHGEQVHAAPEASADLRIGAADRAHEAVEVAALWARTGAGAGEDHDHCDLCPLTREPLPLAAPAVAGVRLPQAVDAARPLAIAASLPSVDLVRFAPKTSPPAET